MTYNQFLNYVKEQSVYKIDNPEEYQATINHFVKNNSVELDGICLHKEGEILSPTVYLNEFYEEYLEGRSLNSIVAEVRATLFEEIPQLEIPATLFDNYDTIRPYIVMRLVNYERNKKQLESCPYLPFCDLAITFRWLVHKDASGIASALITNREYQNWGISMEELYSVASRNTMRLFPARIRPMQEILKEYIRNPEDMRQLALYDNTDLILYVLTNQIHINGSTSMVYDHILNRFARKEGCDFYLLPSSIHEIILLRTDSMIEEESLLQLVYDANRTVVNPIDILSDSIYRYDYRQNRVIMIS